MKNSPGNDLSSVRSSFRRWRERRSHREPIPELLWQRALALIESYPAAAICRELKPEPGSLQTAPGRCRTISSQRAPRPGQLCRSAWLRPFISRPFELTLLTRRGQLVMRASGRRAAGRLTPLIRVTRGRTLFAAGALLSPASLLTFMIQLTPQLRILIAQEPVDFRKGIDGLAAVCRAHLSQDPLSGTLFVFRNRSGTALKILCYDGQGFWLCLKRWSRGKLTWWPAMGSDALHPLAAQQLAVLIYNGDPERARFAPDWPKLS